LAAIAERAEGPEVIRLELSGQRVAILPSVGATVFDYRVRHGGEDVPILDPPPDLQAIAADPLHWGCPILFPFPNRIREGRFTFQEQTHEFTESFLDGHHIHGLVYSRPWTLERCDASGTGAVASFTFRSQDFPEIGKQYPFPFELSIVYRLARDGLAFTIEVRNVGSEPLPMGLGLHPYLRGPISASTSRATCRVRIPARARWELEDHLPTGEVIPAEAGVDLSEGCSLEELELDDVYTYLQRDSEAGIVRCELEDRTARLRTVVEAGPGFREIVVYTPPNRPSVCIEPYTCVTDAPNLQARNVDSGMRVIPPGEEFRARTRIYALPLR
jgi:aldose 1-epimerase